MATAHINIGSNLGDSRAQIGRAVAGIALLCREGTVPRVSAFVESEPWGYSSVNSFLNVGIEIECDLPPVELLGCLMDVQNGICASSHRNDADGYVDRMIDVDLIYYDDRVMDTPELTLPHPRMHLRRFVLEPLVELAPHWVHPVLQLSADELLRRLAEG